MERVTYAQTKEDLLRLPPASIGITNAVALKPWRWFAKGELPALKTYSAVEARPAQQMAALKPREGFVLDWELVEDAAGYFSCGETYLMTDDFHVAFAYFVIRATITFAAGSAMYVDEPCFDWNPSCDPETEYVVLISKSDAESGEWMPGSAGSPSFGEYGPALVVPLQNLENPQTYAWSRFGNPGIISSSPTPSRITTKFRRVLVQRSLQTICGRRNSSCPRRAGIAASPT